MAVNNLDCFSRLVSPQAFRCARLKQQMICKSNYRAQSSEHYTRVSTSLSFLNVTSTHPQQLYSPHLSAKPLPRATRVHCRTIHLSSACCLTVGSSPLLSSRRGKLSNLDDAKQYVSSLSVVQRTTLERALQEARSDIDQTDKSIEGTITCIIIILFFFVPFLIINLRATLTHCTIEHRSRK